MSRKRPLVDSPADGDEPEGAADDPLASLLQVLHETAASRSTLAAERQHLQSCQHLADTLQHRLQEAYGSASTRASNLQAEQDQLHKLQKLHSSMLSSDGDHLRNAFSQGVVHVRDPDEFSVRPDLSAAMALQSLPSHNRSPGAFCAPAYAPSTCDAGGAAGPSTSSVVQYGRQVYEENLQAALRAREQHRCAQECLAACCAAAPIASSSTLATSVAVAPVAQVVGDDRCCTAEADADEPNPHPQLCGYVSDPCGPASGGHG